MAPRPRTQITDPPSSPSVSPSAQRETHLASPSLGVMSFRSQTYSD